MKFSNKYYLYKQRFLVLCSIYLLFYLWFYHIFASKQILRKNLNLIINITKVSLYIVWYRTFCYNYEFNYQICVINKTTPISDRVHRTDGRKNECLPLSKDWRIFLCLLQPILGPGKYQSFIYDLWFFSFLSRSIISAQTYIYIRMKTFLQNR